MITRGKFRSLTLINWNGFFARTFELDELVTTLSGGNGAGKSTTMAAFVTALIPDLTLLHFRNTTEAGATSGSRDKGLHGKLRPGVCYAVLDVLNSRNQRVLCAVRLQQIAGRDKKVDIKPFIIQGLPISLQATEILTEVVTERQARVIPLNELKERMEALGGIAFKQFNAITDYHAQMFDLGVLAKRLRSSSDRSKYYRLIEASLYGGISSAITRSLRDYLLPENSGVRKAFQDMEAALRENRMTLEAIRVTQSDRDFFKHLITQATDYVASDYMRNTNERQGHLEQVLTVRRELLTQRIGLQEAQQHYITLAQTLQEQKLSQSDLETDYQSASDHLNLVQTAVRQQEKIDRYTNDVENLQYQVEEQQEVVEERSEQLAELEQRAYAAEDEVDEIKSQLADYQQALGVQQTRAIQYQQALQSIEKAKEICQLPDLMTENSEQWLTVFDGKEQAITDTLLELEQKISVSQAAIEQFDHAFRLIHRLSDDVTRDNAWHKARELLHQVPTIRYQAENYATLQTELSDLEQRYYQRQEAQKLLDHFCHRLGRNVNADVLEMVQLQLEEQFTELTVSAEEFTQQRLAMRQEVAQLQQKAQHITMKVPSWFAAQDALLQLNEQTGTTLSSSQDVTTRMQSVLENERKLVVERDQVEYQKRDLDQRITRLSQPSGADDPRLLALAERFGGVLLAEIYDDVTLEDAPYFSALYGPSRHAIVVPDISTLHDQLADLDDTPEDLYFIEGDPSAFDDSVFNVEEIKGAILVKTGDRQWRYSRFPTVPIFGRAARDKQLDIANAERDELQERFAKLSFDIQKTQRLHNTFSQFIGLHIGIVFEENPETELQRISVRRNELERQLNTLEEQTKQYRVQTQQIKEQSNLLQRLMPQVYLLLEDDVDDKLAALNEELIASKHSYDFMKKHEKSLPELEKIAAVLQSDPQYNDSLQADYLHVQQKQRVIKQQVFALKEVISRRSYFSYSDSADMLSESSQLSDKLRTRLEMSERERNQMREQVRTRQKETTEYRQTLMSLKSAYDSKSEMLKELEQEMLAIGVRVDAQAQTRAQQRRDELQVQLNSNREQCSQFEKRLMMLESESEQLQKSIRRNERDYKELRKQVVEAKIAWQTVMRLVKDHGIERRLHRHELSVLQGEVLRSRSDKALGSLRLAVADNEHLRDALLFSEDPKMPEKKIQFYIAVYQHLRERIRQDIMRTDDPIEAIEQMEIELSRLTDELTSREQKLAISAKSVANIIRKTIQREQNRIRMLNQGLQSVSFGQVNSVRLNVRIHDTHSVLLSALADHPDQHQDLFNNNRCTFSEALARLYQRLNPQIDAGQRSAQILGEELLDYRNYLVLEVEVNRGTDGWLRAESGALSTGEAIGTGMSILVMVVQSWEEESKRLRGKDILPCRLLFLDEAARLDAKSIATLFELCERLDMQLVIAAPENISPEKGTTYKLVRKVFNNQEMVHVVGLKGFAPQDTDAVEHAQ